MKNILTIIFALILFSCSSSDDDIESSNLTYSIAITSVCPGGLETRQEFCVTKSESERIRDLLSGKTGCSRITFQDKSGTSRTGYFSFGGTPASAGICN